MGHRKTSRDKYMTRTMTIDLYKQFKIYDSDVTGVKALTCLRGYWFAIAIVVSDFTPPFLNVRQFC